LLRNGLSLLSIEGLPRRASVSNSAGETEKVMAKHWTTTVGQAAAHPSAFAIVLAYTVLWLTFSSETFEWNAVATLAVWMMTLFIQRSNRRDTLALHAKLDELLRVHGDARSELTRLDEREPEEIERHRSSEVQNARGNPR
jgi:low affinity Fe/Cu permease